MGSAIIGDDAPGNQTIPEGTSRVLRALPQRGRRSGLREAAWGDPRSWSWPRSCKPGASWPRSPKRTASRCWCGCA